jgi:hypothetical protein
MILVVGLFALPLLVPAVQNPLWEWMAHHREAAHHAHDSGETVKEALHHMAQEDSHLHILVEKFGYLNIGGWYVRFFLYFAILWFIASTLRKRSVMQDSDGNIKHTIWSRQFSCLLLFFFALTATFASVDWLMTLDYSWFSTMWGVYIFAGCAWSSMAVMILLVTWLKSLGYLNKVVTDEHYHLMGKLLFAFTVFWAYIDLVREHHRGNPVLPDKKHGDVAVGEHFHSGGSLCGSVRDPSGSAAEEEDPVDGGDVSLDLVHARCGHLLEHHPRAWSLTHSR